MDQVPATAKDLYNKGFSLLERGNVDYAIDLFTRSVEICPEFLQARKYLRLAQVRRFKGKRIGFLGQAMSSLSGTSAFVQAQTALKGGRFGAALSNVEKLLSTEPLNKRYVKLFVDITVAMGFPEAAVQTLEIYREHFPDDPEMLQVLGNLYIELKQAKPAQRCFEELNIMRPNNPDILRSLKNATALASIAGGLEKTATDFRKNIRNTKQAEELQKADKVVKDEKDIEILVEATKAKIAAEPGNVNYYRQLARLYTQKQSFGEAIEVLQQAIAKNPGDPELDGSLSATRIQQLDHVIATLRADGDEAGAEQMQAERDQFVYEDLAQRVERYPNDLRLRYELGIELFRRQEVDPAIQQFQLAQKNIRHRPMALYYLGCCFREKRLFDLSRDQLEKSIGEMLVMSDEKKEVLYQLGEVCEILGDTAKAMDCFKQVYVVDSGFREVAQKVEGGYR